jgi:hypothetical protein
MTDGNRFAHVTRREFYGALVVVWLYIMLVIGDLLRIEWRWTTAILWFASIGMVFAYSASAFLGRAMRGADGSKASPPSDRVKEIARDPARKIEAIKIYREETGTGLAEAKEVVEAYIDSL